MKLRTSTQHFIWDEKAGDYRFDFGKYHGQWLGNVAKEEPEYLRWMYFDADFGELNNQIIEEVCQELDIDMTIPEGMVITPMPCKEDFE